MKVLSGVLIGFLLVILTLVFIAATGSYNVAAVSSPSKFEQKVATFTLNRSIARHAPATRNPFSASPEVLKAGLAHYKENCVMCHGAPGVEESEAGMGLNPPAPDLTLPSVQRMSDGELFWVVSNGIRMTGMPAFSLTHKPEEIWHMVAFIRHLPEISSEEQKALKAGSEEEEHHKESSDGGKEKRQPERSGGEGEKHSPERPSATPAPKK